MGTVTRKSAANPFPGAAGRSPARPVWRVEPRVTRSKWATSASAARVQRSRARATGRRWTPDSRRSWWTDPHPGHIHPAGQDGGPAQTPVVGGRERNPGHATVMAPRAASLVSSAVRRAAWFTAPSQSYSSRACQFAVRWSAPGAACWLVPNCVIWRM